MNENWVGERSIEVYLSNDKICFDLSSREEIITAVNLTAIGFH